jgi:hypothetical protein
MISSLAAMAWQTGLARSAGTPVKGAAYSDRMLNKTEGADL